MRVLLSGTSNSVLAKSLSYSFKTDPAVTDFTNVSYGASGTVALGDHLRKIDFSQHDFCVLDYCVNEEVFIWQKDSSIFAAMNNLYAIIDASARAGCQPIVMIFPSSTRANHKRPLEEAIIDQLRARGIPVFNFYDFAARLTAQSGLGFKDLFLDPMHVRREIGHFMGNTAITYMKSVAQAGRPAPEPSELSYQPLSFVPFQEVTVSCDRQIEHRETKLAAADLLRITPDTQLEFPLDAPAEVIGMTYNAARTIGKLSPPAAPGETLMEVKASGLFSKQRGLTLVTVPMTHPLSAKGDMATLQYDFHGTVTDTQPSPALELSGFVLRSLEQSLPVHFCTHASEPVILEDSLSDTDLTGLAEVLATSPAA